MKKFYNLSPGCLLVSCVSSSGCYKLVFDCGISCIDGQIHLFLMMSFHQGIKEEILCGSSLMSFFFSRYSLFSTNPN